MQCFYLLDISDTTLLLHCNYMILLINLVEQRSCSTVYVCIQDVLYSVESDIQRFRDGSAYCVRVNFLLFVVANFIRSVLFYVLY